MDPIARAASQRLTDAAAGAKAANRFTQDDRQRVNRALKALKRSRSAARAVLKEVDALVQGFEGPPVSTDQPAGILGMPARDTTRSLPLREPNENAQDQASQQEVGAAAEAGLEEASTGQPSPGRRVRELSELTVEQQHVLARRLEIVNLVVRDGFSQRRALQQPIAQGTTASNLCRWIKRYRDLGVAGLHDFRWAREVEATISTDVAAHFRHLLWKHKAATVSSLMHELREFCRASGLEMPSYPWLTAEYRKISKSTREARQLSFDTWRSRHAPSAPLPRATHGNERWACDHTDADVWVKYQMPDGSWDVAMPSITAVVDECSAAVMSVTISLRYPNAWTVAIALRAALIGAHPSGWDDRPPPDSFLTDRGRDLLALSIEISIRSLGIRLDRSLAHYPNTNRIVERFFETLKVNRLCSLAGYKYDGQVSKEAARKRIRQLLTLPELRAVVHTWIRDWYHVTPHSGISANGVTWTPEELYLATAQGEPLPPVDVDVLLLKQDIVRTVTNTGVRLTVDGVKRALWAPWVVEACGEKVRLACNPDDLTWAIAYDEAGQRRLGELYDLRSNDSPWTLKDVHNAGRARRAQIRALQNYHRLIEERDRPSPVTFRRSRALAAERAKTAPSEPADADTSEASERAVAVVKLLRGEARIPVAADCTSHADLQASARSTRSDDVARVELLKAQFRNRRSAS